MKKTLCIVVGEKIAFAGGADGFTLAGSIQLGSTLDMLVDFRAQTVLVDTRNGRSRETRRIKEWCATLSVVPIVISSAGAVAAFVKSAPTDENLLVEASRRGFQLSSADEARALAMLETSRRTSALFAA
ncbi:MAG: hypothetical protein AB7I52_17725 [Rhizobiaceae bacterium]